MSGSEFSGGGAMARRKVLHILNGDSTRVLLEKAGLTGTLSVWADVLHEGPVPAGLSRAELQEVRARFLAGDGASYHDAFTTITRWNAGLASSGAFDEVVLWFEHDLFDQLNLVHHLDFYASRETGATLLSLICIGEYPGVDRFVGLGQLEPAQLAGLLDQRQPVTTRQLALGRVAWHAFTSTDPRSIERVLAGDTSSLPFLEGALYRLLEEYPSVDDGLGRTERQILSLLARRPYGAGELFRAAAELEERPFMGDLVFRSRLQTLGGSSDPALEWDPRWRQPELAWKAELNITDTGRALLAGARDWVRLNGIDRWFGGVHLHGHEVPWRWNEQHRRLESPA